MLSVYQKHDDCHAGEGKSYSDLLLVQRPIDNGINSLILMKS